jgi:hypothetical protein
MVYFIQSSNTQEKLTYLVKGERPTINPEAAVYWFFAHGWRSEGTVETGDQKSWRKRYAPELVIS